MSIKRTNAIGEAWEDDEEDEEEENIPHYLRVDYDDEMIAEVHDLEHRLSEFERKSKEHYRGIDGVIDRLVRTVTPWNLYPDIQTRPTIINLWGMTGSGKTTLVRCLANDLGVPLIETDVGSFTSENTFSNTVYETFNTLAGKKVIICLDDLQIARTVDDRGGEKESPGTRALWSLLSDGKISINQLLGKERYINDLEYRLHLWNRRDREKDYDPEHFVVRSTYRWSNKTYEFSLEYCDIERLFNAIGRRSEFRKWREELKADFGKAVIWLLDQIEKTNPQVVLDFTKACIIVCGNLDELYTRAYNLNPDISPDELHEWSKSLTLPDVKTALEGRFRLEQIARLGNNHIIYPAFRKVDFEQIIKDDLERVRKAFHVKLNCEFVFDESVIQVVYREGVYPTQGARPVLSTVSGLVEPCMGVVGYQLMRHKGATKTTIKFDFDESQFISELFDANGEKIYTETMKVELDLEKLRTPKFDDRHATVAVHEAGHAVVSYLMGETPIRATAFSPNANSEGYCEYKWERSKFGNKKMMETFLAVALGGWAAEKEIFGTDMLSNGCSTDISMVTGSACMMIDSLGMGRHTIHRNSPEDGEYAKECLTRTSDEETEIEDLIRRAEDNAETIVQNNRVFVLDLAGEMLRHYHLDKDQIEEVAKRNGVQRAKCESTSSKLIDLFEKHGIKPPEIENGVVKLEDQDGIYRKSITIKSETFDDSYE